MRVLLFRNLCDRGGVATSMLLLGREMEKRGIECEFWFCSGSDRLPDFLETGRTTVGPLAKLAARLERADVDVVQMTASDPMAEVVAMMSGDSKVLVSARGALADIWDRTNCFAYSAISQGMATVNQPYTDVEIEVVRNAIDVDRFTPGDAAAGDGPIVAFVGRTSDPIKDFPRFTRIGRRLAAHGARIWIADPHNAGWERFEGRPGVERIDTERWGRVSHAEIADFYRAVAASGGVVLMTSRTEGFGNVAPEAAACGAWVVAPDVMGLNEAVVDGVTGNLFPADASDEDVAEMISGWMAERRDVRQVSDAARREFAPSVMMEGYQRIYDRREQLVTTPTPKTDDASLNHLHEHLARQRSWRASAARDAAVGLAADGRATLALGALGIAFRAEPKQFLSGPGFRSLLSTMRRIPNRRARQ